MEFTLTHEETNDLEGYQKITSVNRSANRLDAYTSIGSRLPLRTSGYIITNIAATKALDQLSDANQDTKHIPYEIILDTKQTVKDIVTDMISKIAEIIENFDDPIEKQNLFTSFVEDLQVLWDLRKEREEEFAELIVLVESVTRNVNPQDFTEEQFKVLQNTVITLGQPVISRTDLKNCRDRFRNHKLDIYRPLKGNSKIRVIFSEEPTVE